MTDNHDYLINQVQPLTAPRIKLNFNHPVKELIWVTQQDQIIKRPFKREYVNFSLTELSESEKIWFKLTKHKKKSPGIPLFYFYKYLKI